ncbi:hypothetical protein [Virgibacillus natechei]
MVYLLMKPLEWFCLFVSYSIEKSLKTEFACSIVR